MDKFKLLLSSLFIVSSILIVNVANAEVLITHDTGANISYTLNSGFSTEKTFTGVGTISVTNGVDTITILDRNLGATKYMDKCLADFSSICTPGYEALGKSTQDECVEYFENQGIDGSICVQNLNGYADPSACLSAIESEYDNIVGKCESYGYFFQRGNNYGFSVASNIMVQNGQVPASVVHPGYTSGIFYAGYENWLDDNVTDLWGGSSSDYFGRTSSGDNWKVNNPTDRKGPCPKDFHIPSYGELLKISEMMSYDAMSMHSELLLPMSSSISYQNGNYYTENDLLLRSSSPATSTRSFFLLIDDEDEWNLSYYYRANGYSIRCVYDFYETYTPAGNLSSEGGELQVIVNIGEFNGGKNTCTGENYIFSGIIAGPSLITRALTKTFQCAFGESRATSVTIQLSGDLVDANGNTISSGNVKIKNSAWTSTPTGVKSSDNVITEYTGLNKTVTLFNKAANIIGTAVGNGVDIQLEILGGTPDGTYNGTLVLTY